MKLNPPLRDWFFPIGEGAVLAAVTCNGAARNVTVPHKKAIIAADTGDNLVIIGAGSKVFTVLIPSSGLGTLDSVQDT